MVRQLTRAFGGSAAMMPGSVKPRYRPSLLRCLAANGSALHGALHGPGAAARAYVEASKTQFIADELAVVVLRAGNGMATPAHREIGSRRRAEDISVAQGVEHRIGDASAAGEVEGVGVRKGFCEVDDISKHGKEQLLDPLHHAAVDEGTGRRLAQLQLDAPRALEHLGAEVCVAFKQRGGVVAIVAAIEHGKAAAAEKLPRFLLFKAFDQVRLKLGEQLQGALGRTRARATSCLGISAVLTACAPPGPW